MSRRGEQAEQPTGVCKRVIDFLMSTLFVKSVTRRIAFVVKRPSGYRHVSGRYDDEEKEELVSIRVVKGKRSEDMSPEHEAESEGLATHHKENPHEVTRELPVHFKPHYLDVEPDINEKTDEFIRSRRAAMHQTDSIEIRK